MAGRPPKNNCEYFPHDAGMRNHRKVKALRNTFANGYAIWSMLLEYLTEMDGNTFEYSDMEFELISGDFGISVTEIRDVVDYCVRIEMLFLKEGFVHSESLDERLSPVYEKRGRAKELSKQQLRSNGKYCGKITEPTAITVTEIPQSKVNRSKENKSTVKKKEVNNSISIKSEEKSLFSQMNDFYNKFCIEQTSIGGSFGKAEGVAMNSIIGKLKTNEKIKEGGDTAVLIAWEYLLSKFNLWTPYQQQGISLLQINKNLLDILNQLKTNPNGKPKSNIPESQSPADVLERVLAYKRMQDGGNIANNHDNKLGTAK